MRIDSVRLFRVPCLDDSTHAPPDRRELIVVAITAGGQTGWGDVLLSAAPRSSTEWSAGAFNLARDWLAPALVGQTISSGQQLQEALAPFQGNAGAKSALDVAWWNLHAALQSRPLYESLGGQTPSVSLATSIDRNESTELFLAEIQTALSAGYDHVVLKFRPGWDLEMLRAVRHSFGSDAIAVDCEASGTLAQQDLFYRLEDFFLKYVEQPLSDDDLVGHAMLQQGMRTPVCLDESITSPARAEQALDLDSCRSAKIDLGCVGGLTPAWAIGNVFAEAHVPCGVKADNAGPLSERAALALATLPAFSLAAEYRSLESPPWLLEEPLAPVLKSDRLVIELAEVPHVGPSVDAEGLAAHALEVAAVS